MALLKNAMFSRSENRRRQGFDGELDCVTSVPLCSLARIRFHAFGRNLSQYYQVAIVTHRQLAKLISFLFQCEVCP